MDRVCCPRAPTNLSTTECLLRCLHRTCLPRRSPASAPGIQEAAADASVALLTNGADDGIDLLQRDILASTKGVADPKVLMGNLRVLRGFPVLSGEAVALLREFSKSSDIRIALWAFARLVRMADCNNLVDLCRVAPAGAPPGGGYNFAPISRISTPYLRQHRLGQPPRSARGLREAHASSYRRSTVTPVVSRRFSNSFDFKRLEKSP